MPQTIDAGFITVSLPSVHPLIYPIRNMEAAVKVCVGRAAVQDRFPRCCVGSCLQNNDMPSVAKAGITDRWGVWNAARVQTVEDRFVFISSRGGRYSRPPNKHDMFLRESSKFAIRSIIVAESVQIWNEE